LGKEGEGRSVALRSHGRLMSICPARGGRVGEKCTVEGQTMKGKGGDQTKAVPRLGSGKIFAQFFLAGYDRLSMWDSVSKKGAPGDRVPGGSSAWGRSSSGDVYHRIGEGAYWLRKKGSSSGPWYRLGCKEIGGETKSKRGRRGVRSNKWLIFWANQRRLLL